MAKKNDLTAHAVEGYNGTAPAALYSSPVWYAQSLGAFFQVTGRPVPRDVSMSRGASMNANGLRWKYVETGKMWERA
jgi:hypothetical protein